MNVINEIVDAQEYAGLLSKALPHVIHTEQENERCTAELEVLLNKSNRSPDEDRLLELLTFLIEDYEERNYVLPASSPLDLVRHLMDVNDLRQA